MHRLWIAALPLLLAGGCATIASRAQETITVTSEPSGADVSLACGSETHALTTPARFLVDRRTSDCTVTVRKEGFETETTALEQGLNAWTWGNIPISVLGVGVLAVSGFSQDPRNSVAIGAALVLTGLGGLGVDRLTGRLRDHDPKTLHIKLRAK